MSPLAAGDRLGPFELVRYVHRGASGEVWVGRHDIMLDYCAVKVVPQSANGRAESRYLAGLPSCTIDWR